MTRQGTAAWIGMAMATLATASATAQERAEHDAARTDVVVTAHDGGQSSVTADGALGARVLLDTPFSQTVVTRDDIDRRQVMTVGQIFLDDPSVFSAAVNGTTNWWGPQIRGLPVQNMFVDDVPLQLSWGGEFPIESVDRVEALKGLSGFMYGFGTPGGVFSYRTKRPTAEPLLSTEIVWRSPRAGIARIDSGGPIAGEALGYRLNLAREAGVLYNRARPARLLVAPALAGQLSPSIRWHATATYEHADLRDQPVYLYMDDFAGAALPAPRARYEHLSIAGSFYRTKTLVASSGLDWQLARDWSLGLTYGYTSKIHVSRRVYGDLRNEAGDYRGHLFVFTGSDRFHFAQALLQGEARTGPFGHHLVAGASATIDLYQLAGRYEPHSFDGNLGRTPDYHVPRGPLGVFVTEHYREPQAGQFLSDTIDLDERYRLLAGVRRTVDRQVYGASPVPIRSSALTPTVALIYKPRPFATLYASYVQSLEAGGRVPEDYANGGTVLPATVSTQREIGVKYDHAAVELTGALFRVARAAVIDRREAGQRYQTQDGLTLYKGAEAIARYAIDARWRLGLGLLHLDPRYRRVSPDNAAIAGHVPMQVARWQATGSVDWEVAGLPGLSLHGNLRYAGKAPITDADRVYTPASTLAYLGGRYETRLGDRRLLLSANVNNVFDHAYWSTNDIGERRNGVIGATLFW
ncbi:TonB-dependent receptor [Sphingomonas sp. BK235]|uniref:TonB-dependent siderophore receptor n=1 Tax=Sphingomonas sp. BK235 TaxID=2512131 RepID=UPI001FB61E95|nr:TonB-dependent receptor [Sphingomonas sp. BK235]